MLFILDYLLMTDRYIDISYLLLDCYYIHWIAPVYGFLGSTINK